MGFPFARIFDDEFKGDVQKTEKEAQRALKDAATIAGKCLATKDFQKYRQEVEKSERLVIAYILSLSSKALSAQDYAFKVSVIVERLRAIKVLLRAVENDMVAGRKEIRKEEGHAQEV